MDVSIAIMIDAGINKNNLKGRVILPRPNGRGRNHQEEETIKGINDDNTFSTQHNYYRQNEYCVKTFKLEELKALEKYFEIVRKSFTGKIQYCKERKIKEYDKVKAVSLDMLAEVKKSKPEEALKLLQGFVNDFFI